MKQDDLSPQIILLIGLPATGKSTYVRKFLADNSDRNYVVLSTDDILSDWGEEEGLDYSEAFKKYASKADKKFKILFRQAKNTNSNIIVDRTNLTRKGRNKLLSQLSSTYHKIAVVFDLDPNELKRRVDKREIETGKRVPDYVIKQMMDYYVPPTNAEFDEIIYV